MKTIHTFLASLALLSLATGLHAADLRPNILFILADDLRPDGLHALGNPIVKTPHLDRFVEQGFVFRAAYVQGANSGAVCTPSRTMIQTGQSYLRTRRSTPTLAQTIQAAGYASIRSGKFDNNPNKMDQDFDRHLDGQTSEGNADNIIAFIKENAGKKPLFLYFAPHEPHDPQYAPDVYYAKYHASDIPKPLNFLPFHPFDNGDMTVRDEQTLPWPRTKQNVGGKLARYYASTTYLDDQAGRLIDALKQAGQFEHTIIIIAGDNGLSLGEHGLLGKQNLYEFGGMHVPLAFYGPGIPKGETHSAAYLMDVYPTICDLIGTPPPKHLDARSQLPVIQGKAAKVRDYAFTSYLGVQRAIRTDRWKLIRYPQIDKTQLFDLDADSHEMNDLAGKPEQAEQIAELTALLKKAQAEYEDDCPLTVANPHDGSWSPEIVKAKPKPRKGAAKRGKKQDQ